MTYCLLLMVTDIVLMCINTHNMTLGKVFIKKH